MTEAERRAALEQVAVEVRACTRCRLHEGRTSAVPGEGHPSTEVMLVGEAPGLNEDRQGRPFVGAAGGFLTELLGTVGWSREEVFITNVVKCRPPQNRDPEPDEIAACAPFLRRQVEVLDPALVVTLGRHSMGRFMPGARIGQVHGTTASPPAETGAADALVFAMYHPAAALHQGSLRQTLLDDMASVPSALLEARRRRDAARGTEPGAAIQAPEAGAPDRPLPEEPVVADEQDAPSAGLAPASAPAAEPRVRAESPDAGSELDGETAFALEQASAAGAERLGQTRGAEAVSVLEQASAAGAERLEPAEAVTPADVPVPPATSALSEAPTTAAPPLPPAPDGAPSVGDGRSVDAGPAAPLPALVPGLEAPATDQMTLF